MQVDGIEVIEIGVPAEHVTEIDHVMDACRRRICVPTGNGRGSGSWHNVGAEGRVGAASVVRGFECAGYPRSTQPRRVWRGSMVVRPTGGSVTVTGRAHDGDILFSFVMAWQLTLEGEGKEPFRLSPGDAFVIPPGMATRYRDPTQDLGTAGSVVAACRPRHE